MRQAVFVVLYTASIVSVILGARRFLRGFYYSLEDWRHYRIFVFLRGLNFESIERMRLMQRITIEKYMLKRRSGHITYSMIFGGLTLFVITLVLAAVWIKS